MLIVGRSGDIVYLNTLAAKLFGYQRNELLGRSIETLVPPEARAVHGDHRKGYFQHPRVRMMETGLELFGLRKDSSRFPIEISLSPLHTSAGALVLGAVRDRTRQQRTDAKMRELNRTLQTKIQELAASSREMEELTYSTAHDLRAPVRHMQSFAELVRHSAQGRLQESELEYLDKISTSAKRLGVMIDGLLDFSRIGRTSLSCERVPLTHLIGEIQEGFQKALGNRQVTWKVGALPAVSGDPAMLRELFSNLLENAVKFTRGRAEAIIEIGCDTGDGWHTVFVRDNGAGYNEEHAAKLFQIFQRLHRHDEFEGNGIGLATVRRIAERHGGKVSAQGTVGSGATFFVSFPEGGNT
jgi:PAS domain S-box-containing protein